MNALRYNLSLRPYFVWLALMCLAALGAAYLYYLFTSRGWDLFPLCNLAVLWGGVTAWIHLGAYYTARRLFRAGHLSRPVATALTTEAILANLFVVGAAVIAVNVGDAIAAENSGTLNVQVSFAWLLSLLGGSLFFAILFYPLNLLAIGQAVRIVLYIRKQSIERFGNEFPNEQDLARDLKLTDGTSEAEAVQYDEIWISSRDHLRQLKAILDATPASSQALAGYVVPAGFPHTSVLLPWMRIPLAITSRGIMRIGRHEVVFRALNRPIPILGRSLRFYDLNDEYKLRLDAAEIGHVVWHQNEFALRHEFNFPWISLQTQSGELLIVAGAHGLGRTAADVRGPTHKLFSELIRLVGRSHAS